MGTVSARNPSSHIKAMDERGTSRAARFALTKFRPPVLPATLITRSALHDRLAAGAGQRVSLVTGAARGGKRGLRGEWAAGGSPAVTSWLSCDTADVDP